MGPARRRGHRGGAQRRAVMAASLALLAFGLHASPGAAPPATASASTAGVIYRCTATDGVVALQDEPCPRGQRQEWREIAPFAPPPTGAANVPSAPETGDLSANTDVPPPGITPGEAPPPPRSVLPPPLWRCTDLNGQSRLADAYDPQPRCVPLSVRGVDLSRAPPSASTLCRTVEDACVELGGEAACAAWEERLADAESALRRAFSDTQDQRRRERDRAKAIVENDCRD
ncbi:MAG: DUF4124 domain-containing protein [Lysobacteraceae bacterium]